MANSQISDYEKLYIDKIKSCYFELISTISIHSYETLLLKLTENLNEILDTFFVGIYVSDQWDRKYRMLSHTIGTIPDELKDINQHKQLLHELLSNRSVMNGEEIFSSQSSDTESKIIKLNASYRSVFLLLYFKKNHLSNHLVSFIHKETDRLMSTIHDFFRNKDQDIKKEFLLDLSSQMNSLIEKKEIFNKLIASLQILYPNFSYNLLLSHDYETDGGLPIKLIEYSDDITKHLSAKAFTSGKIQIESHEDDQSLYAPLTGNQGIYGVIQIITPKELKFPTEEIEFIRKFANTAGNAIENAKLYQDSMQLAADLKHINDITHKLNSNLNFTEQIETVKKEILAICKASEIGFVYHREMISDFEVLENSTRFFHTKQGRTFVKYLSREMKEKEDSLFIGNYTNKFMQLPFKSLIVIPMTESGLMYGFVIITHENNSYFTFESFKLLQSLIYHSTLALTNALLRDTLEEAVITDYLTKLYSRSHLDEMLNKHMQTDQRGTLILLDIDDFKTINDTYGHYIGDEVIVQIAEIIANNIDEGDIPTRWGGEEFAIYLPHKEMLSGVQLAEKIRDQVNQETEPQVTFSCGISTWDKSKEDSVSEVFIRADKALYEAKEMGKNCIVTSE